ncbi:NADH-quinone oxidoreductase subunit NuoN [Neomegalonema perideroedes]|uniref:NADH-quinone oxidoreductase subunit NuoN n=1 Tax=Neomegalonema perideroedes TaxID=217219 RepID=UPI00037218F6|nr:NADH-quinone oxidoreductase subunit NuoN [Neomegalonema perideroedes]
MSLNLAAAAPELILAVAALAILMFGVLRAPAPAYLLAAGDKPAAALAERRNAAWALWFAVGALILAALWAGFWAPAGRAFSDAFILDGLSRYAKVAAFLTAAAALALSRDLMGRLEALSYEYAVLVVLAALGMGMMASANDLISLYIGLELQSLALYVLAALRRDDARATEAGLKYFVLGALSSGLLLFGASFVYGYTGSINFDVIRAVTAVEEGHNLSVGLLIGISLMACGIGFKLSAAPFHMWTPDVYQGAPLPIAAFFASAAKIAAAAMLLRLFYGAFGEATSQWRDILAVLAAASMLVGGFGALVQTNVVRLLAYSSIGNVGFALTGMAAGTAQGISSGLLYMVIYAVTTLGVFAFLFGMRRGGKPALAISDFAGLARRDMASALCLGALMFSLAGVPPLAGFFAKLYAFQAAWTAGLGYLLVIAVLAAVVSAFYYIRVVKVMFFDEPAEAFDPQPFGQRLALYAAAAFSLIFVIGGFGLPEAAQRAATALIGGGA